MAAVSYKPFVDIQFIFGAVLVPVKLRNIETFIL